MPFGPRPVYQERTSWAPWMSVILWGTLTVSAILLLAVEDGAPLGLRMPLAVGTLGFGALLQWLVGGLTVRLRRDAVEASLGHAGLVRTRIPYEDILKTEVVRYAPIREFGGWGYRYRGSTRAWTARGDEAVVLHLVDGRRIYLGSERPGRLRARILAVAGTRLGAAGGADRNGTRPPPPEGLPGEPGAV